MSALLQSQVVESLDRSALAFTQGLPEYFDVFASDAMIVTADSKEPIKGREAYRQHYASALSSHRRAKTILDRSVQIVGDKAVVTQKAQITEADKTVDVFQTMVYGQTNEGLKVVHAQTSVLAPENRSEKSGTSSVRVVNERIATISSVLGVAQ